MGAYDVEHIELKHEPLEPCRPDVFGEEIFVEHWRRFLNKTPKHGDGYRNEMFESLFWKLGVNQRNASVAASFMAWLGTNCGSAFLYTGLKAYRAADVDSHKQSLSFLVTWAVENMRRASINSGSRTIEAIVGKYVKCSFAFHSYYDGSEITYRDTEVCEVMALFLGSHEGQELIKSADNEITETRTAINDRYVIIHRARLRALKLLPDEKETA